MSWAVVAAVSVAGVVVLGVLPVAVLLRRARKLDAEAADEWEPDPDPPFDYRDWWD